MSYKEDFYRMLEGKTPVSDVPVSVMSFEPSEELTDTVGIMSSYNEFPAFMTGERTSSVDAWGVESTWDVNGTGPMPTPGRFILPDVTKWRDVIKAPYKLDFDFKAAAEKDMAVVQDRDYQLVTTFGLGGNYFLQLAGFMGFEGAMLAMYDEPEAMHELLDYLCDYDVWYATNFLENYDVDVAGFGDDNATELNPFISMEFFREFLLPRYDRLYKVARDHGLPISYHNCGRCEDFMDDMINIGVKIWNCATPVNDLLAFKQKYENKIILEFLPRFYIGDDEATTRQKVRDYIDLYAPGGAFVFAGGSLSMNPELNYLSDWISDEARTYGKGFYA